MPSNRRIAGFVAAALSLTGTAVLSATPAQAASNCRYAGSNGGFQNTYYCNNVYGARVYESVYFGTYIDHLYTTTSWFVCKFDDGAQNGETAPHPYRWLATVGDQNGEFGWVSDRDISSETNSVPDC